PHTRPWLEPNRLNAAKSVRLLAPHSARRGGSVEVPAIGSKRSRIGLNLENCPQLPPPAFGRFRADGIRQVSFRFTPKSRHPHRPHQCLLSAVKSTSFERDALRATKQAPEKAAASWLRLGGLGVVVGARLE